MANESLTLLKTKVQRELTDNLLPFWRTQVIDHPHSGFIGRLSNDLVPDRRAAKGLILNARLLWSYSAIHRFTGDAGFLTLARRAYDYLIKFFIDEEYGGAYWFVDFVGVCIDGKKKIYGQAFMIYALAEYYQCTGDKNSLDLAVSLYGLIEQHAFDKEYKGYVEAFERDWSPAMDLRLSAIDMNEKKSMNTHLHVLEAYANLYRVWKNKELAQKLDDLLSIFTDHIINPEEHHFNLFFDEAWTVKSQIISFGHDIEGSWLLCEAADVLEDGAWKQKTRDVAVKMADAVLRKAIDDDGGMMYEGDAAEIIDTDKHWWPQAEGVVGFLNAFEISGDDKFLQAALNIWNFIEQYIVDKKHGEWFWRVSRNGQPYLDEPKVSEWKSAYHNSRTCMEILHRIDKLNP
jgi:cellobiose epimerase